MKGRLREAIAPGESRGPLENGSKTLLQKPPECLKENGGISRSCDLAILNQEDVGNLDRLIKNNAIEAVIVYGKQEWS